MEYLLDTVAVVRHFSGHGKMGNQAANILDHIETREDKLFMSAVSLMEILYLAEKHRISITLPQTLDFIESKYYGHQESKAKLCQVTKLRFGLLVGFASHFIISGNYHHDSPNPSHYRRDGPP